MKGVGTEEVVELEVWECERAEVMVQRKKISKLWILC